MSCARWEHVLGIFIASILAGDLIGQRRQATIEGVVTDPSGAVVPNARVEVAAPGSVRSAVTDTAGRYSLGGLQPGSYQLKISAPGFSDYESAVLVDGVAMVAHSATLIIAGAAEAVTVEDTSRQLDMDASNNAGALIIKGSDLASLSDDPDDLSQDLQALAGPSAGPNGAEIYLDGFSGGRLPPKSAIREIRVNQNPFSAEYDRLGYGRIEIFTKPGTDRLRGEAFFNFGDAMFNARNPFSPDKPDYQRRMVEGNIGGSLTKRSSFFAEVERRDMEETSVINAQVLDSSFAIVPFRQALLTPTTNTEANVRIDYQLTPGNTLIGRYDWEERGQRNSGLDTFSLPSRALNRDTRDHVLQITDTAVLSPQMIHEVRMQFAQTQTTSRPANSDPAVQVLDAFSSGGSTVGSADFRDNRWEATDLLSFSKDRHVIKLGGRVRTVSRREASTQNFNGTFTFDSLDAYRSTVLGMQMGLSPREIRAQGGGASQFSITAGEPAASVRQVDAGVFVQDDWRVHPRFTITAGLRYEVQNNIGDRRNFAPRAGFAWAPGASSQKQPYAIVRAGFGMFYDRVGESLTLDARRLNGRLQTQYIVDSPDFYPSIPTFAALAGNAREQTIRIVDASMRAPYVMQTAVSVERQFSNRVTTSITYMNSRGVRALRSRNINAPLPDTYVPGEPSSGSRLYPGGNLYLYEATGFFRQNQVIINMNARVSAIFNAFGYYTWGKANSDTDGSGSFPASQFDLRSEYGRAGFDVRHRAFLGASITTPYGFMLSPFVVASSGPPFNIMTGRDLNGDSLFTDRPVWAADPAAAGVIRTAYGNFDTAVIAPDIIPRNVGNSPGMLAVNLRISKSFALGRESSGNGSTPAAGSAHGPGGGPHAPHGPGGPPHGPGGHGPGHDMASAGGGRYALTFSVSARNILNTVNPAAPIGNLNSPRFGTSVALATFGHRGGSASANRSVEMQVRFSF